MATRAVLTLDDVIKEVQNGDSNEDMSEGSEDDFEGYLNEEYEERGMGCHSDDEWSEQVTATRMRKRVRESRMTTRTAMFHQFLPTTSILGALCLCLETVL